MPSTAGWLMPSLKPNCSRPSAGTCTSRCQTGTTPGRSRTASSASLTRSSISAVSWASAVTTRCTSFGAQRRLPVLRRAVPHVADHVRPGGHALLELLRERGQRLRWHAERLQPLETEGHRERDRPGGVERGDRLEQGDQPPQQLAPGVPVVDPQRQVGARVGMGPGHQRAGLDVAELELGTVFRGHGRSFEPSLTTAVPGPAGAALPPPSPRVSPRPARAAASGPAAAAPRRRPDRRAPARRPASRAAAGRTAAASGRSAR